MSELKFKIGESTARWASGLDIPVHYAASSISTNTLARENFLNDHADLKFYLTDDQRNGRGRNANAWSSPPAGCGLLSSWSFKMLVPPQPVLSPLVGYAVYDAASLTWPDLQFSLKAPNDLYLGDKKLAGLLIEIQESGGHRRVIIGLGLNVFASPADVATSTSLASNSAEINEERWWTFLRKLHVTLLEALGLGTLPVLSAEKCRLLRDALNKNPLLTSNGVTRTIFSVEPDGSLRTSEGLTKWSDL